MNLLKYNFKLFLRNKTLLVAFFIPLFTLNAFLTIYLNICYKSSLNMIFFHSTQRFSLLFFILFSFISYEFFANIKLVFLDETVFSIKSGNIKEYINKFYLLIIIALIFTINIIVFNIIMGLLTETLNYYYIINIIKSNILNCLLVSIFAIMFGILLALKFKRLNSYISILLCAFLSSSFLNDISRAILNGLKTNIYPIKNLFSITTYDLDYIPDLLYGVPVENVRWFIIFFWMSLFTVLILFNILKNQKVSRFLFSSFFLLISIVSLILYANNDSIRLFFDSGSNGSISVINKYYYENKDKLKKEQPKFAISSYEMNFKIDNKLNARVKINLKNDKDNNNFIFTLDHSYIINSIKDINNNQIKFNRELDYFSLITDDRSLSEITIEYSGFNPLFYSNNQGVALLGNFAYYPIEGYKKTFENYTNPSYQLANETKAKSFKVIIDAKIPISCNLDGENGNYFGKSTNCTIIGGLISKTKYENIDFYNYIVEPMDLPKDLLNIIDNKLTQINNQIGSKEDFEFKPKKIIALPLNIPFNCLENVYYLDNCLVISNQSDFSDDESIYKLAVKLYFSSITTDKNILKDIMKHYFRDKDFIMARNHMENYNNFLEQILKNNTKENAYEITKGTYAIALFQKNIIEFGNEFVLKASYNYLIEKGNNDLDEIEFLKKLRKE